MADISTDWYTRMEQGRPVRVSVDVLERIARALRLDAAERTHLFELAHHQPPHREAATEAVAPAIRRMLDGLGDTPAYVTGRRWDVLVWNRAAAAVFGDYTKIPERERNIVRLVFTAPEYRQLMVDWESDVRRVLALFRADYGRHTGDHDFEDLTNELRAKSTEFRVWWAAHDIAVRKEGCKEFRHHEGGRLMFEHTAFYVADELNLKLVIYTALGETANKVTRLLSSMPPNALSPQ